ncbi:xanthine dehydrogenase, molybdenum binding subunit XdhA [Gottschalkia acidurici 9a]|uniref:Xanthine dehydrogenase, molybdenum binding subunit XdhA n=1 Tax=Gottschalkia acidurici (strain ATCC 7906 / DSM 604 / BCRC 14475 / CIP 104303 / KCTC 5404 / NCIMB 10678 / 9a) TaxID=1128398 RepID=K0B2Q3_GOTA9|nr:molybdopterin cofactor-binding domain-containing protein [Gottschalkia acidurici]AFS79387.1 xanthine dehydrogenase, molybdenum binding subunit XdhA [Gottschalkia acidurici 9a]
MKEVTRSIPKVDGMGLILGKPVYTDDLAPRDSLIVKILRSPHAFAKIKSVNKETALKVPGIECILTYEDMPKTRFTRAAQAYPETSPQDTLILDQYVRYVGDDVAIIAATSEESAKKAMKLIKVDYEILEPLLDIEESEGSHIMVHPEDDTICLVDSVEYDRENNIVCRHAFDYGNLDKALSESDLVVERTYYTQAAHQGFMETYRSASYLDHYGRLVVISSTQVPFHARRSLSKALGIPLGKIRVIKPRVGGGYGGKQSVVTEYYPALVTLKTGKPAKLVLTRQETFEAGLPRVPMRIDVTVGANNDGRITAIDLNAIGGSGGYGQHSNSILFATAIKVVNLYNKVDAAKCRCTGVYTNTVPTGAFRGFGATQGTFALESTINEIADMLDIDPTEIRKKNMVNQGETVIRFDCKGIKNTGPIEVRESCGLKYCIQRGKELIGWDENFPGEQIAPNKFRGFGMAISKQGSGVPFQDMASASIKFVEDGSFILLVGAADIGQGSDTVLSQICAETLGVKVDSISIVSSDTDTTPFDSGAYASSTTYVTGNAVKQTAEKMKDMIFEEAARILNVSKSSIRFDGKNITVCASTASMTLEELGKSLTYAQKELIASDSYLCRTSPAPYLAAFAEVEVNTDTGKVFVNNFITVIDIGTPINPALAKVQVESGIMHGIGMALHEEVRMSKQGKMQTNTFMTYKIPTREDVGNIIVEFDNSYEPSGPYGAKSVGEIGINTSAPAIREAIYNAIGIRLNTLPMTPEKVLMALKNR